MRSTMEFEPTKGPVLPIKWATVVHFRRAVLKTDNLKRPQDMPQQDGARRPFTITTMGRALWSRA